MNIIIFGFKHCGKTSVGKEVAKTLNKKFIDTDELIEEAFYFENKKKLRFPEIYKQYGEIFFRDLENRVVKSLVQMDDAVIALGGGSVLIKENVSLLKKIGKLVYLNVHQDILKERIKNDRETNLILQGNFDSMFAEMYLERSRVYKKIADLQIDDQAFSVKQLALTVVYLLKGLPYGK